jgi:hypothetical protein
MSRLVIGVLLVLAFAACSTRGVVVAPEEVSKLNDPQWTIKSPPRAR